jgi:hypothetical protein
MRKVLEERTSGLKPALILHAQMPGMNPGPTKRTSFSANATPLYFGSRHRLPFVVLFIPL